MVLHNGGLRCLDTHISADAYHLVKQLRRRGWEAGVVHRRGEELEERIVWGGYGA